VGGCTNHRKKRRRRRVVQILFPKSNTRDRH
jgi:hypothetical protein